jgi:prepilin-type processing-associated H-X9-DG protein
MSIPFTCPHCGHQTNVADEYAGQSGPCSSCGKTVTIPAGPGAGHGPPKKSSGGLPALVIVLIVLGCMMVLCVPCLIALLLPAIQSAREAARRASCTNHLKQIGLALHMYHDTYNSFPPAYVPDENGRPAHSWRVLILPFLEENVLYQRYDFNEPWDSPANQRLAEEMVSVYRCPSEKGGMNTDTSYVMIVGPNTISDGPRAVTFREIADGTAHTIAVVEMAGSGIHWMEPRDLPVQGLYGLPQSQHYGVANVLMCDGSVRTLGDWIDPGTILKMATIDGGEPVEPWEFQD